MEQKFLYCAHKIRHWILFWASWIQSTSSYPVSLKKNYLHHYTAYNLHGKKLVGHTFAFKINKKCKPECCIIKVPLIMALCEIQ